MRAAQAEVIISEPSSAIETREQCNIVKLICTHIWMYMTCKREGGMIFWGGEMLVCEKS